MKYLKVLHDDNGIFVDHSLALKNYSSVDTASVELIAAEDYLYVGLDKQFYSVYVEFSNPNANSNTLAVSYYNGTSFVGVTEFIDESKGFTRSGFISWGRDSQEADWSTTTVNSEEKYWIRIKPSQDHSVSTIRGLNIVFSNDEDLKEDFFEISQFLPQGEPTFILKHQAAKKDIVQLIRNRGTNKTNPAKTKFANIDEWDFLLPFELRQSSKFLTLHKIFINIAESEEDNYSRLAGIFYRKFGESFDLFYLTIDNDDDGIIDQEENVKITRTEFIRS